MPLTPTLRYRQPAFRGRIGVARAEITPPIGIYARNWGAAQQDQAEGVHRPLLVTAIVFRDAGGGGAPLILVGGDLMGWGRFEDDPAFTEALKRRFGVGEERLIFQAAHTHAGPSLSLQRAHLPGGEKIPAYLEQLKEKTLRTIESALADCEPALLTWHQGRCALAQNRDLPDPAPGKERIVCGYHPDGDPDDYLLVGRITTLREQIKATIVNYACHPVTLAWQNRLLSPDWVGAMRETVESHTGQAPCLFLQGASGDLGPREQYLGETGIADAHGREAGYAALAVLEGMLPPGQELVYDGVVESGAPLATWKRRPFTPDGTLEARVERVTLPLRELPSVAEVDRRIQACTDRPMGERLRRLRERILLLGEAKETTLPVWAWRLGEGLLVGYPAEAYSQLQREIRQRLAPRAVAVMNLVNGTYTYLPPAGQYARDLYQVWVSPLAPGCLEKVTNACEEALRGLLSGPALAGAETSGSGGTASLGA